MVTRKLLPFVLGAVLLALALGGILLWYEPPHPHAPADGPIPLRDDFNAGEVSRDTWGITREGDTRQSIIDAARDTATSEGGYRLRLGMDTIGTRDDTVKFLGVRSVEPVPLGNGTAISFSLDWNNQSNGCYLTASVYLCPTITDGNPEDEDGWLKFEYIGVPPGHTARSVIASKAGGRVKYLSLDGWPDNRTGRPIGNQEVRIVVRDGYVSVQENGRPIYQSEDPVVISPSAYLYLQMSSHSNYPLRVIYFDDIMVGPVEPA
jgi:hypothetical protein